MDVCVCLFVCALVCVCGAIVCVCACVRVCVCVCVSVSSPGSTRQMAFVLRVFRVRQLSLLHPLPSSPPDTHTERTQWDRMTQSDTPPLHNSLMGKPHATPYTVLSQPRDTVCHQPPPGASTRAILFLHQEPQEPDRIQHSLARLWP